ncbi:hypothetical protein SAMN04487881_0031 [Marinobacter sp. es.048]|uniref:hypothetical protein n=1 Tax=Marinobacter sp. es.048 TaxID=1761795 RepID=UPI000B58BBBE|nr:hypothetical protein [Marinobacter sp. es.048]SNC59311.1 hypothetical protein SAMN04487881_0031 [Marinobacter sp. es.048]
MVNESAVETSVPTVADLEAELWQQKLYDPEVFEDLVRMRTSLRLLKKSDALLLALVLCGTVTLGITVHWVFGLAGAFLVLFLLGKKRSRLADTRNSIDKLIGEPDRLFNSIAVNKIMMEAFDRSPQVAEYLRTMERNGRRKLTYFETEMLIKILAALDREEAEVK